MRKLQHNIIIGFCGACIVVLTLFTINTTTSVLSGSTIPVHVLNVANKECNDECEQQECDECIEGQANCKISYCEQNQCKTKQVTMACNSTEPECYIDSDCRQEQSSFECEIIQGECQYETAITLCEQGSCIRRSMYNQCSPESC